MTLTIRLFGIPEVIYNGKKVHFKTTKAFALLAFLAVEQKSFSREYLISLLWPESNENLGRASLRNALSHLRRVLNLYSNQCLITQEDTIEVILPPEIDFDVRQFDEVVHKSSKLDKYTSAYDFNTTIDTINKAVTSYRGEFLDGVDFGGSPEFDDWITVEREYYHQQLSQLLAHLFELQTTCGQKSAAINTAKHWFSHDPYNDEACRSLMKAYFVLGEKSNAMHTFDKFRTRLERELKTIPEPQTEAFAHQLKNEEMISSINDEIITSRSSLSSQLPFVGRAQEFNQLVSSFFETKRTGSRILAIIGEAGIGKTRLVQEFLQWVKTQNAEILLGSAWEGGNRISYQQIVESLRIRFDEVSEFNGLLDKIWLAELSRLLPEIRSKINDLPQPATDESTARQALFEAVTQLAGALARKNILVWVLEDLHWSDIASMDLLSYALRAWSRHKLPILMIVTVRKEAISDIPNFKEWLAALSRDVNSIPIELGSLNQKDVSTFVEQLRDPLKKLMWGNSLEEISTWLWEESEGQPLLLTETVRMYLEKDNSPLYGRQTEFSSWRNLQINPTNYPMQELTSGISRIVQWRMSRLSPIASELARAASILGHQFPFSVLIRVAEVPEDKALPAIEELINGRILQLTVNSVESGDIFYQFPHGQIKAIVESSIPQTLRMVFHRRAFHALLEYNALPAELAYHALKSHQLEQGFRYCLIAGNNALELFDPHDAIYFYEKARQLLNERVGPVLLKTILPVSMIEQLYIKLSLSYEIIAKWDNARKIYETMLNLAKETNQSTLEWTALNRLAILAAQHSFNVTEAIHFVENALFVADQIGDPIMISETEWNLMQMATFSWQPEQAIQHGERALVIAKQLGESELTARILYALGDALSFAGRWEECNAKLEEALPIYNQINQNYIPNKFFPAPYVWAGLPLTEGMSFQAMQASCMSQLAEGYIHVGKLDEGIQIARKALEIGVSINNDWTQAMTSLILCNGLIEIGLFEEAYYIGLKGVDLASKSPNPALIFFTKNVLGLASQTLYEYEDAHKQLLEALEMVPYLPSKHYLSYVISKLCMNAVKREDWHQAIQYAYQSIENRRTTPASLIVMDLQRHYEIGALLHIGDVELARQEINQFNKNVGANQRYLVAFFLSCATLNFGLCQYKEATQNIYQALEIAERIGLIGEIWQIYKMLGQIYEADNQEENAARAYKHAQVLIEEIALKFNDPFRRETFICNASKKNQNPIILSS